MSFKYKVLEYSIALGSTVLVVYFFLKILAGLNF
jgi:hypothetical protein